MSKVLELLDSYGYAVHWECDAETPEGMRNYIWSKHILPDCDNEVTNPFICEHSKVFGKLISGEDNMINFIDQDAPLHLSMPKLNESVANPTTRMLMFTDKSNKYSYMGHLLF
jgi:hypothetical protein